MNTTKQKGMAVELRCQLFFIERGFNVCLPICEDSRYDMIVDINNVLYRIQVKSSHETKTCSGIEFSTSTNYKLASGNVRKEYTEDEIDFFMTSFDNQCYLIPIYLCGGGSKVLVYNKNGKSLLAEDFKAEKILDQIKKDVEKIELSNKDQYKNGVKKIDKNTGEVLKIYDSYTAAANDLGDPNKTGHISQAARKQRKTAYGFVWEIF